MPDAPLVVLFAGPNGAGKSTLYRDQLMPLADRFGMDMGPFLNAGQRWGADHDPVHDYEAAQHIAQLRDERMTGRAGFTAGLCSCHTLEACEAAPGAGQNRAFTL